MHICGIEDKRLYTTSNSIKSEPDGQSFQVTSHIKGKTNKNCYICYILDSHKQQKSQKTDSENREIKACPRNHKAHID